MPVIPRGRDGALKVTWGILSHISRFEVILSYGRPCLQKNRTEKERKDRWMDKGACQQAIEEHPARLLN